MKKRALSLFLAFVMVIGLLPSAALATEGLPLQGQALEEPLAAEEWIEVSDQAGLAAMKAGGSYKLTQDVVLDSTWSTISYFDSALTFDGNGHTITLQGKPLFAELSNNDTVTNLILDGSVESDIGNIGALANSSSGIVRNCISRASVSYTGTSPYMFAGGLVGSMRDGSIANCFSEGTVTNNSSTGYGAIANIGLFVTATISNCVGVGVDRIASEETFGDPTAIQLGSNMLLNKGDDLAEAWTLLDTNRQPGDCEWKMEGGTLTLVPAVEEPKVPATQDEINALNAAIDEAEAKTGLYTTASWSTFSNALEKANQALAADTPEQSKVISATAALTKATADLMERIVGAVGETGKTVVEISDASELKTLETGNYYKLTADITVNSYYGAAASIASGAVLDGNGHVITVNAPTLFGTIPGDAVVQNLGVLGICEDYAFNDMGALANTCAGVIVNCWSQAQVKESSGSTSYGYGGLVGKLTSGGAIVNCYAACVISAKGENNIGMLVGKSEPNTLIQTSYWPESMGVGVGGGDARLISSAAKTKEQFRTIVSALLNANKGAHGTAWGVNSEGWPYHGEDQEVSATSVEITFTPWDGGDPVVFNTDDSLTLNLISVNQSSGLEHGMAGTFSCEAYPNASWGYEYTDSNARYAIWVGEDGRIDLVQAGTTNAIIRGGGLEKEIHFPVTVVDGTIEDMRLAYKSTPIENGTLTVAGSERVYLEVQGKVGDTWQKVPASLFTFTCAEDAQAQYDNVFTAPEPGDFHVTVTGMDCTAEVTITSTYVPVTSIHPNPNGTYVIHERHTFVGGGGVFWDLSLSHNAGTVTVLPDNASYKSGWTVTTSDPSIAQWGDLFGVYPQKAGTVTLTATSNDPVLQTQVTGTSTVTLEYANPLSAVAVDGTAFTVKENEQISLPITFTGSNNEYKYVTEPAMNWNCKGDGQVVVRKTNEDGVLVGEEGSKEYCVANWKYEILGTKAGTVTVTGTPVDQTNTIDPVTFTVIVTEGTPEESADNEALTREAIPPAQDWVAQQNKESGYVYGREWEVFTLTRSGKSIAPTEIAAYLDSVEAAYQQPGNTELKPTTLARVAVTLGVLGEDASDFRGINFIEKLCNSDNIAAEMVNEPAWALIALDSKDYDVPAGAKWDRDALIAETLRHQADSGALGGVDLTGMAIQALAPYYDSNDTVKMAVDKALTVLSANQDFDGGFGTVEATAQVLVALTSLDKDPVDASNGFVKSVARNLITNIYSFRNENTGAFQYNDKDNAMSTMQGLYALESYRRFLDGENALYDLTDVNVKAALEKRIQEAESLTEADYTAESWSAMQSALAAAKAALSESANDDAALKAADDALAAAIAALVKVGGGSTEPEQPGEGKTITVTFKLTGDKNKVWIASYALEVKEKSTVWTVFSKALQENNLSWVEGQYNYISGIQIPGTNEYLSEFDRGPNSGWMYTVNGTHPDVGLRDCELSDGDEILWHYVEDYKQEGSGTWDREESAPLTPSVTVDKNGEAKVTVSEKDLKDAIADAKSSGADAIVIAPEVKGDADKVAVELPRSSVAAIGKQTDAALTVQTGLADVTVPNEALTELGKGTGKTISVSAEAVKGGAVEVTVAVDGKTVEELPGGVAVSLPVEKATPGTVLVLVDKDGSETVIKKSLADGEAVSAVVDGSCTVKVVDNAKTFTDVKNDWTADGIAFASGHELFNGVGGDKFAPDLTMDRAMLANVLFRLENGEVKGDNLFTDVAEDAWYAEGVVWANEAGIVTGTGSGFMPTAAITREQMATMLYRYAKLLGLDTKAAGKLDKFSDGAAVSDWAKEAMAWAVGTGLVSGDGSRLAPDAPATRAQVAAILMRFQKNVAN